MHLFSTRLFAGYDNIVIKSLENVLNRRKWGKYLVGFHFHYRI